MPNTLYVDVWLLRLGCNFVFEYPAPMGSSHNHPDPDEADSFRSRCPGRNTALFPLSLASVGLLPYYGLLRFLPIVIAVSLAMIIVTFYPLPSRRFLQVAGYFYGIGFVAAGSVWAQPICSADLVRLSSQ